MTIVAGFEFQGVPMLVGDLLITATGYRGGNPSPDTPREFRQKIVKLANSCVIGWAGNLKTADELFRKIRSEFRRKSYSLDRLNNFLESTEQRKGKRKVEIVGWVADEGVPQCFSWESDGASYVKLHDSMHGYGSGYPDFQSSYYSRSLHKNRDWSHIEKNLTLLPAMHALFVTSHLMEQELHTKFNASSSYGGGYEVLFWNGKTFEYLTDTLYLYLTVFIATDTKSYVCTRIDVSNPTFKVISSVSHTEVIQYDLPPAKVRIARPPGESPTQFQRLDEKLTAWFAKERTYQQISDFYVIRIDLLDYKSAKLIDAWLFVQKDTAPAHERLITIGEAGFGESVNTMLHIGNISEQLNKAIEKFRNERT